MLGWFAAAEAAVPVVHDSADGAGVLLEVAERTGLPPSQLVPTPLDDLLRAEPAAIGDATIRRCSRAASTNVEIQAELVRAEAAWSGDRDGNAAMDHLDLVVGLLGCLGELVDARAAADGFGLRGGVAAELGETDMARGELRTAIGFAPELIWAPRWPAAGQPLLDEQRAVAPAHLSVSPDDPSSGPWLDGKEVHDGATAIPGLHLLQYSTGLGIRSAWVTIGGDVTLVVPGNYKRPVLQRIESDKRGEVEGLLAAGIPAFSAAYVSVDGGVWLVAKDGDALSTTEISPPPPPPEPTNGKKPKKNKSTRKGR